MSREVGDRMIMVMAFVLAQYACSPQADPSKTSGRMSVMDAVCKTKRVKHGPHGTQALFATRA